jgi:hypothetical protein
MLGKKLDNNDALKFIFAGKSIFTCVNTNTSNRFTFRVKQAKDSNLFFVSVLTSTDVYTYLGTITNGVYKHGKKSNIGVNSQSVKVFQYVISKLLSKSLPDIIEVWHEGKCGKCGRNLTVPSSIANGIGPECIKRLSKAEKRDKFLESILS